MTHTYKIEGMTCSACVRSVEERLAKVPGITNAKVNLSDGLATVEMNAHVTPDLLQRSLMGTKYHIGLQPEHNVSKAVEKEEAPGITTYLPVFLIFGYITLATLLVQFTQDRFDYMEWMRHFMAGFFLVFSFFKLLDVPGFAASYSSYDIIAARWPGYGYAYPFLELGLGLAFLFPQLDIAASWIALPLMTVSIIGVISSMLKKRAFQCACLGVIFKLPLSRITLFEDALMILMSGATLLIYYFN